MTSTASPELAAGAVAQPRRRARRRTIAGLLVVLAGAAALVVAVGDPFSGRGDTSGGVPANAAPTALARVERRSLSSRTQEEGTLRFAGSYSVVNGATGALTALPRVGEVIRRGQVLYRAAGDPVVLLYGRTPAYRTLKYGMSGPDVRQLNANLVALGYASSSALDPASDDFGAATTYALQDLQEALDVDETGTLELGDAVFLPGPARITKVTSTLGTTAQPGAIIAEASSTRREVVVDLDATQQASVKAGDRVAITLPNGRSTPGVVRSVGKVASSEGSSDGATIPVRIAPRKPRVTGSLDQATVQVAITTARAKRALVVPVTALLALAGGGYAVETVDARGVHQLVPVKLGLFDDAGGLVQVRGSLTPGQRIVVPATT
jgi:peptidoglycan hydrolase-like protein with peptidoglycan-binding domain